jgi:hypothetical protein
MPTLALVASVGGLVILGGMAGYYMTPKLSILLTPKTPIPTPAPRGYPIPFQYLPRHTVPRDPRDYPVPIGASLSDSAALAVPF